jgi:hypothetical protein
MFIYNIKIKVYQSGGDFTITHTEHSEFKWKHNSLPVHNGQRGMSNASNCK